MDTVIYKCDGVMMSVHAKEVINGGRELTIKSNQGIENISKDGMEWYMYKKGTTAKEHKKVVEIVEGMMGSGYTIKATGEVVTYSPEDEEYIIGGEEIISAEEVLEIITSEAKEK